MPKGKQAEEVKKDLGAGEEASVSSQEESKATSESETEEAVEPGATGEAKSEVKEEREKPTRSEKRIQQLLDKLKTVGQQAEQTGGYYPPADAVSKKGEETRFPWEEQLVPGREYTVDELQGIIRSEVQKGVSQYDRQSKVKTAVGKFAEEMEWLVREAPELKDSSFDERLSELIVKINSDELGRFVPKMAPKEIYNNLRGFMDKARVEGSTEASASLHESREQGAVAPGSGKTAHRDYEEEALFNRAVETGSTEDWANLIKRRQFGKK